MHFFTRPIGAKGIALSKIDCEIQLEASAASRNPRLAELRRELGAQLLSDEQVRPAQGLASQWASLDSFVVGGGWPRGELSWIEAPWGCGATTLIARSMAPLTQRGQAVAWVHSDSRLRLNPAGLAASWRVQPEALLCVHTPRDTREQERRSAWAWQEILATRAFSLVVLDLRTEVSNLSRSAWPSSNLSSAAGAAPVGSGPQHSIQHQLRSDDSARGQEAFPASRTAVDRRARSSQVSRAPLRPTEIRQLLAQARRSGAALILLTDLEHSPLSFESKTHLKASSTLTAGAESQATQPHQPISQKASHSSAIQQLHQAAALALRIERREVWITRAQHRPTPHRLERSYAHVEAFLEPVDPRLVLRPRDRNRSAPDRSSRLRGVAAALLPAADLSLE